MDNLFFCQPENEYRINEDSIYLSRYIPDYLSNESIMDIGSGTNIIPILLARRGFRIIFSVEIQKYFLPYSLKNIAINSQERAIALFTADARVKHCPFLSCCVDNIVSNPPYYKTENSRPPKNMCLSISKQEIKISHISLKEAVSYLLKKNGNCFLSIAKIRLNDYITSFSDCFDLHDYDEISKKTVLLWLKKK